MTENGYTVHTVKQIYLTYDTAKKNGCQAFLQDTR